MRDPDKTVFNALVVVACAVIMAAIVLVEACRQAVS